MKNTLIILALIFLVEYTVFAQVIFLDANKKILQDTLLIKGENPGANFIIPTDSIQIGIAKCDSLLTYSMIEVTHIRGKRIFGNYPFNKEGLKQDSLMKGSKNGKFLSYNSCELIDSTNIITIRFSVDNVLMLGDIFIISVKSEESDTIFSREIMIKGEEDEGNSE